MATEARSEETNHPARQSNGRPRLKGLLREPRPRADPRERLDTFIVRPVPARPPRRADGISHSSTYTTGSSRRIFGLRIVSFAALLMLVAVQFGLAMAVDLFGQLPGSDHGRGGLGAFAGAVMSPFSPTRPFSSSRREVSRGPHEPPVTSLAWSACFSRACWRAKSL
jgi:hypothetical protein